MDLKRVEMIVNAYGAVLMENAGTGVLRDIASLPASKGEIKSAVIAALGFTKDPEMRRQLAAGYVSLADFQPLSDAEILGAQRLAHMSPTQSDAELLKSAAAISSSVDVVMPAARRMADEAKVLLGELRAAGFA
ncbi:MAG: hypothetical protein WDM94_10015 [Bauldia sp.]